MDGRSNKRRRRNNDLSTTGLTDSEDEDAELDAMDSDAVCADSPQPAVPNQIKIVDMSTSLAAPEKSTKSTVVGGALKRNPDGTLMAPRIVKRKKNGQKVCLLMIYCLSFRYISIDKLSTVVEAFCAGGSRARL